MLKRLIYILVMLVLPLVSFGTDQANDLFAKGNALYAKAQYKIAMDTYQKLIDEGYRSSAVYFNLGNACYKNGDIPSALLYYEKAHKLSPGDDDINFNIRFANSKTTDKVDEAPEFFLNRWGKAFILSFSLGALSTISIVFALLASVTLIVYFFTGSVAIKKSSFYGAIILFFLCVLTVFVAVRQSSYFENHKQAIIFSSFVNVKSGPVDKSNTLFVIHDGTKVNVLEINNDWMKVGLANGNVGWIKVADAKAI